MLAEAVAALASTGSAALVTAMVTDGWEDLRARFARLFGRAKPEATDTAAARLEQSRTVLAGLTGADLDRARAEQEIAWRTRLVDLLDCHPHAEQELRVLIDEIQARTIGSAGRVQQHAAAFDQAQQAVLGHGVQNVTFGGQRGPDASDR